MPVFLPFFGCPRRCLFCAQEAQTGRPPATARDLAALFAEAAAALTLRADRGLAPAELAFYGGTFTALPAEALEGCLAFAASMRRAGLVSSFRCSTRPDALDAALLKRLADAGCAAVELGVQTFSARALKLSGRGYGPATAREACALVAAAGLGPVVQLLPGMPGVTPEIFREDVAAALAAGACALRFYPCLVFEGTGLAARWREGSFRPWPMEETLEALAHGWLLARKAGAPVLRMGVAPGEELSRALLAGPWHPALGSRALGRALLLAVAELLRTLPRRAGAGAIQLDMPASAQGHFWGHGGELRERWAALGIGPGNVRFVHEPVLRVRAER